MRPSCPLDLPVDDKLAAVDAAGVDRLLLTTARREAGEQLVNDDAAEARALATWTRR